VADLEYTVSHGIGTILLNRPATKNAFTYPMIDEWAAALHSARTDPDVWVVVVTGADDAELLWTGDFVTAEDALRLGIASSVYPDEDFRESWHAFAARLAASPPLNVQLINRAAYQSARADLRTALDLISSHMAVVRSTRDSAEAMHQFRFLE
jgi:enoyl-CoA hydratase/carnithine racemase